jgi:hypothetical protein
MAIRLFKNIGLTDANIGGQTSSVGEPSVCNTGAEMLLSGNWYTTKSVDRGATWSFIDPYHLLPPAAGGFCCDQVVAYDPGRNLVFWLLQYVRDNAGSNVLRLAVKPAGTLNDDAWWWWDFAPATTNPAWGGEWFDFPDIELGSNSLYMTTNSFAGETWRRSVVFRLPLQTLADKGTLQYQFWNTTKNFALRCVRGAGDTMYFASHNGLSQVRLFTWPEANPAPSFKDVNVSPWAAGTYSAPGPDGTNWLGRCDPRITGAWLATGAVGLAWSANRRGPRPFPYVRVVDIDLATHTATDRDIWNPNFAYAYPNTCPNDRGDVGITLFRGGNMLNPSLLVGIWNSAANKWNLKTAKNGTNGPNDSKWGDYLTCRRHAPDGVTWIASGYTLQGGGDRTNAEPRVVVFGLSTDTPG